MEDSTCIEHLVRELSLLLKLLENESVSSATAEKMNVVRNLVKQLQPSVNGSDFIYMNTSLYGNGTSFVESLFEEFDCDLQDLRDSPEEMKDVEQEEASKHMPIKSSPTDTPPPPLPTTPPPDDYYEEAAPLGPGTAPQYITTRNNSSPPNSIEDAYYEDADNNYPTTRLNGASKNSYNDSDALSSSYESYDEEDEEAKGRERTHQWPSEESPLGQMKDCRKCAFLLRKKRFGQWAKQLTIIRENKLQCFKNPKDRSPHVDLPLNLCNVIYVPKDGRRKKHELRFSLPGGEALVLAVQSKEQAESWLKVIQEVSNLANNMNGKDGSSSPMILRKLELDKMMSSDKHTSDSDSAANGDVTRDICENGKAKKGTFSELTGSMSRAAGRKINRIISFSKKKPSLPGETNMLFHLDDNPRCGYLNVLVNQCWKERWCCVRNRTLYFHKDRGDVHTHVRALALHGVDVLPGLGPKHPFAFRIMRASTEVAALEASCSVEMGRWLGVLLAEAGSATVPEELHYDYVDVDTISSIQNAARNSFLWATSDPRMYDEVPYESILQAEENESKLKRYSSMSSVDTAKGDTQITVKRHGSSVNHYGKYGKTRAEEDARRFLNEKEQLEKEKEEIKESLVSLRSERSEVRKGIKNATDLKKKAMEQRLAQLEESCRQKEAERVDLELRLTEVKEKLKKSLTGGMLGAPQEKKPTIKASVKKKEHLYTDATVPVNCASEMKKRPLSIYASAKGNVMQKAKEWESKKVK
ncbi:actin filament-associated protein 1-like 1b isoform X1 [Danio rerio]|uniref:Actin filament-associated protein 1-like 1 n=1 Tax=Danio rerio TaxID=7955 RepID=E9QFQ2_DANRE|nr:actin filament-associated protein 1-like 1 isoform X1 [Danio rerio]|eukprot:XP_005161361.1 actin filament-associated protein 1-like 1 isoform X1 [Danio rerio]